ncbi:MAG: ATP-binding cassette domain-containing protein [Candidatus Binatia bacterium]|nr:ATP-binding cassette domain-containing protein [Candidatus Binatia bacterium]
MVTVSELSKQFGSQLVLDRVDWFVPHGARIALVGANGSGKSTLLRLLAGRMEPDSGRILIARGVRVGYLEQEVGVFEQRTVLEAVLDAFSDLAELEKRCRELEDLLASTDPGLPAYGALLDEYGKLRDEWDRRGAYDLEARARAVLVGLGFCQADLERPCHEFSGGWQMRIALAKLLVYEPELLLLDEPTNHLDLDARNWLEEFLRSYPHSFVLVAHDRYFMDACCSQVSEVARGKLSDYSCPYSEYLVQREERVRQQEEAYRLQQEEIARIQAFISRFRYQASKAALVQSRIKQLEKMQRLEPPEGFRTVRFRFPQPPRSGRIVLDLRGINKTYGTKAVYRDLCVTLERGRKVAIVGPNGAGKSTLMRILAGVEAPDGGVRRVGHNVAISYFAQDRDVGLAGEQSVLDFVTSRAPMDIVPQVRTLLGAFLFSGDAVYKPVRALSGGERSRLALALLLLQPTNCLLLDEPTNHLDLSAKEVLLEALRGYEGTLVFVAHDRYFLDQLPEEIWEVSNGSLVRYLGNYEDYLRKKSAESMPAAESSDCRSWLLHAKKTITEERPPDGVEQRRLQRELRKRIREIEEVEAEIAAKEAALEALRQRISEPTFYTTCPDPHASYSEFARVQAEIERLYGKLVRLEEAQTRLAAALATQDGFNRMQNNGGRA